MKNLLTTILILTFFSLPFTFSFAQTDDLDIDLGEDIETNIPEAEENRDNDEDIQENTEEEEERESLANTLQQEEIVEIQPDRYSFWTILGAILIPSIFIIIAYLILKFFQT